MVKKVALLKVWVTRAQPAAAATARRLSAAGFEPVVAPLLETRPLSPKLDLTGVGALAFTSANGLRHLAPPQPQWLSLPVFAVGAATAAAAREAGFTDVSSADGDVAALARLIVDRRDALRGGALHLAAKEPAGDLLGALVSAGVPARAVAVYETVVSDLPVAALETAEAADFVLLHSPRAARRLQSLITDEAAESLLAVCLSPAVAAPLAGVGFRGIAVAAAPNEASLIEALQAAVRTKPEPAAAVLTEAPPRAVLSAGFWAAMLLSAASLAAAGLIAVGVAHRPAPPALAQSGAHAKTPPPIPVVPGRLSSAGRAAHS